jgi:hypothetical protein
MLAELDNLDARTNGIPPIPETFSQEAKEALAKLWGEYTALVSSTGEREGRKFGRHWRLSKRFLLELLPMRSCRNAPITHRDGVNLRMSLRPKHPPRGASLNCELAATDDLCPYLRFGFGIFEESFRHELIERATSYRPARRSSFGLKLGAKQAKDRSIEVSRIYRTRGERSP